MAPYSPPLFLLSNAPLAASDASLAAHLLVPTESRVSATLPQSAPTNSGAHPIPVPGARLAGFSGALSLLEQLYDLGQNHASHVSHSHVSGPHVTTSHVLDNTVGSAPLTDDSRPGSGLLQPTDILAALLLTPGSRRVRSGSLFLTHSIWNDDVLSHLPVHAPAAGVLDVFHEGGVFLTPPLLPQTALLLSQPTLLLSQPTLLLSQPTRNRSHTTSVAAQLDASRLPQLPFAAPVHDALLLLDSLVFNMDVPGRNRSQTYLGVTPTIGDIRGPTTMSGGALGAHLVLGALLGSAGGDFEEFSLPPPMQPLLQNDFVFDDVVVTTNFENPSLGPTNTLVFDNVPLFVDAANLCQLMHNSTGMHSAGPMHGRGVVSVRVSPMTSCKMALVECASVEVAMALKASFNHLEIVPGVILYVAFATVSSKNAPRGVKHMAAPHIAADGQHVPVNGHSKSNGNNLGTITPSSVGETGNSSSGCSAGGSVKTGNSVSANSANTASSANSGGLSNLGKSVAVGNSNSIGASSFPDDPVLVRTVARLLLLQGIDINKVKSLMRGAARFPASSYSTNFGPLPEPIPLRQFDSPKLRELRKLLENNERLLQNGPRNPSPDADSDSSSLSQLDVEDLALAMLDELPELCHDHIGNTIVQKMFTVLESPLIKLMMVKEIAPYLAQLSIHKNGTWAIQKIINLCHDDVQQKLVIATSLRPYAVKLFNDQFGNYVLQCCLKFGSPFNDFIFETMVDNFLTISSGRFGARCIRAILESSNDPKAAPKPTVSAEQVFLVASLIVEHANELAVNSNGSLLITWFLDTFTGCRGLERDNRYDLLCEKFLPHLDKLCTHKLGNLTVFKILNNRSDYRVKQLIMDAIFGPYDEFEEDDFALRPPSPLLETILLENPEHNAGSLFIYKILSNPILLSLGDDFNSARYQQFVVSQVKRVLLEMNIMNLQPYKKLVDEVGLSTNRLNRTSSARKNKRSNARGSSKVHPANHQQLQLHPPHGMPHNMPPMGFPMNNAFPVYPPPSELFPPGIPNMDMSRHGMGQPPMPYGQQQFQQEMTMMHQLEQLSLSSAALGYTSNPGTPNTGANQRGQFF